MLSRRAARSEFAPTPSTPLPARMHTEGTPNILPKTVTLWRTTLSNRSHDGWHPRHQETFG
ncbi:hypothetical protein B0H13DRAFT_2337294 [Mycena leptocephala]|nr:hypothetical protein B0H13DRAFT_2337294 [Mycena leptocephala]